MTAANVRYDDTSHTYTVGNRVIPSVTQILVDSGIINTSHYRPCHAERGTYIHTACEMYDRGELDEDSVDPDLMGYFSAWKKFRREVPAEIKAIEEMVLDADHRYAGRYDRLMIVGRQRTLIDIKTSASPSKWWGVQLAGYALCIGDVDRVVIRLDNDGFYHVHVYDDVMDFERWEDALAKYEEENNGRGNGD